MIIGSPTSQSPSAWGTRATIGSRLFPKTAAETAAGAVIVNGYFPSHDVCGFAYPERYGAVGDGVTNDSAAFSAALSVSIQAKCAIGLTAKVYVATLSIQAGGVAIIGPGSDVCTIINPAGALSTGGVIEVGNTALGNGAAAYDKFVARGFTIDGNRAAATAPVDDLHGHGMCLTKITHFDIDDVRIINAWNAGLGVFILSNYGKARVYVENCGDASFTPPGVDINSSSYSHYDVTSYNCNIGARILDNCYGNVFKAVIGASVSQGFVYNNQSVNFSYGNVIDVTVSGSGSDGIQVGENCHSSHIRALVNNAAGNGVQEVFQAANPNVGNNYDISTYGCTLSSCIIGGNGGNWRIASMSDGTAGAAGSSYAVQISGNQNNVAVSVQDQAIPHVRGINVLAGATSNYISEFNRNTLVSDWTDAGTGTAWRPRQFRNTFAWAGGSVPANGSISGTFTVNGAKLANGDIADVRFNLDPGGVITVAEVTAANTVKFWIANNTTSAIVVAAETLYGLVTSGTP